jgi:hypothetical protein
MALIKWLRSLFRPAAPTLPAPPPFTEFPGFLLKHAEGEELTEESVSRWHEDFQNSWRNDK